MRARPLSDRTVLSLQAILAIAASVALALAVPHRWLRPVSIGCVVVAALVVFGIRAYLRRLEAVVSFLDSNKTAPPAALLVALLTESERKLLGLQSPGTGAEVIDLLRRRQSTLVSVAMCVAIPGVGALLVAVFLFSD